MVFSNRSCLFFFFLTFLLISTLISARDSYSFGKFQRENPKDQNPNNGVLVQTNETTDQDDQKNPTFLPQSENGYGLYGRETTYDNNNNNNNEEMNNRKYDENVNYDDSFSTPSLSQTQEPYNNYGENYPKTVESYDNSNNNNNNNYGENYPKTIESYDNNNYKDTSYYENPNGYKGYSNNVERQGMSDTRFIANGNYYYDLDDERNHGRYYKRNHYNYKPTGYSEKSSFENPYSSKNLMNQRSEMFGTEQGDQFTP